MTCKEAVVELVEYARHEGRLRAEPGDDLRGHLAQCEACSARFDAERQLAAQFRTIRQQTAALGSPAARRETLVREFSRRQAPLPAPAARVRYARWAMAVAAGLIFAVILGHQAGLRSRRGGSETRGVRTEPAVLYESDGFSSDASALSSDDFIAIPYTPPLAPGEMVRIFRTDMYPEALASMGVRVDSSAWSGRSADVPVEMVVGEDGIPRAVRITESSSF